MLRAFGAGSRPAWELFAVQVLVEARAALAGLSEAGLQLA